MTQIIAFAGRKQSGKNTSCNFIVGHCMRSLGIVRGLFQITKKGELWVSDLFGDENHAGVFDITRNNDAMRNFLAEHLDSYIKLYSFADPLKVDVCMNILGLSYDQCYGSDESKNSLTPLKWEDMPGVITESLEDIDLSKLSGEDIIGRLGKYYDKLKNTVYHKPGPMTAREVLQFVGTEIFRKMYGNCWVDATIRKIQKDAPLIALLCDCRFPNEVQGIQEAGGIVVRLTRNSDSSDTHASETALDRDAFDWDRFNLIIDNKDYTIEQQNHATYSLLVSLGLVDNKE